MRTNKLVPVLASLALLGLTACTSVPLSGEMAESIANARTAADHQRIADFFAQKATNYDTEAAWHEKMANSYGGYPRGPISYVSHCRSLQQGFAAAAKDARALEEAHRRLAAGMVQ